MTAKSGGRSPVQGFPPILGLLLIQLAGAYLILGFYYTLKASDGLNPAGNAVGVDFIQYYAASELALEGLLEQLPFVAECAV